MELVKLGNVSRLLTLTLIRPSVGENTMIEMVWTVETVGTASVGGSKLLAIVRTVFSRCGDGG